MFEAAALKKAMFSKEDMAFFSGLSDSFFITVGFYL